MGDSPIEFLYRTDIRSSHGLAFDLMCYGSTELPAFDGTLSTTISNVLPKLSLFASPARRILEKEFPEKSDRDAILTTNSRYQTSGHNFVNSIMPVVHILNGIIHCRNIWMNHIFLKDSKSWQPSGSFLLLGFGFETDQRRVEHVDLFGFANGFLSRKNTEMNKFFDEKGRG